MQEKGQFYSELNLEYYTTVPKIFSESDLNFPINLFSF
ncbi:hypothetical protein AMCSP13_002102 [Streptococcus pneumoniae 2070335]|nr:hypothetical protein AMCSP13_002102 [Streptococcus pneumoniae 2070335]